LTINIRYSGIFFASERWSFALNVWPFGPIVELCSICGLPWLAEASLLGLGKGLAFWGYLKVLCSLLSSALAKARCFATLIIGLVFTPLRCAIIRYAHVLLVHYRCAQVVLLLRTTCCAHVIRYAHPMLAFVAVLLRTRSARLNVVGRYAPYLQRYAALHLLSIVATLLLIGMFVLRTLYSIRSAHI
jgi:hypothetical protein